MHSPKIMLKTSKYSKTYKQQGIALYVIIILVLLSMLLALWAARSSLFNELLLGNDADYQRTFEAAQAMLQDAEFDIRGTNADGSACNPNDSSGDICRRTTAVYFDIETKDLESVLSAVAINSPTVKCYKGICQKRADPQDFWNDATTLSNMIAENVGARYGQFTGATTIDKNKILSETSSGKGAWYWVEILPYVDPNTSLISNLGINSNVERFAPARKKLFVYRITALARGLKASTEVVLQSTLSIQAIE